MTGPFQVMPPLSVAEYSELRMDIAANGITVPVVYDQHGRLIDGHHRVAIAAELGIDVVPQVVRPVGNAQEARSVAYALNLHRRHLDRETKRALLAASIKADPDLSDRQHAARVGSSPSTAGAVRSEMEDAGELSKLDSRTGADGKSRPAHVTTTTRTSEATKVERDVDMETGEIVDLGSSEQAGRAAADAVILPAIPRDHERERIGRQNGNLASYVQYLTALCDPVARARYAREWDPANCDAYPHGFTPDTIRETAHALLAFADELESSRGLRVV